MKEEAEEEEHYKQEDYHYRGLRADEDNPDHNVSFKGGPERADPQQRGAVYEYRTLDFGE